MFCSCHACQSQKHSSAKKKAVCTLLTSKTLTFVNPPPTLVFFQCKFKPFYKYAKSFNSDDFDYDALEGSDYIFMRWKVSLGFVF